jgi:hypothetical protein
VKLSSLLATSVTPCTQKLAVPERLSEYLDHPLVRGDERLRLRVLIIEGETDEDLDPSLAQRS